MPSARFFSRRRIFCFAAFFLFIPFLLTGCAAQTNLSDRQFCAFLDRCFQEEVSSDTVTLHFKLSDPSAFGLSENETPTYGNLSSEALREQCRRSGELLDRLEEFDPDTLNPENAFIWEMFRQNLEANIEVEDYLLLQSPLGTNGLQSQIPVTLSEYYFDDEADVRNYLSLISQIPDLFSQILAFEQERREADITSPDFVIEHTIDQIDRFLTASEDENLLVETFEERLEQLPDLSEDQKNTYVSNNRALVRQVVLPAYESLKQSLEPYLTAGSGEKERLCQYEGGKEYYELILSSQVGTDMSPEECIASLEETLRQTAADIVSLTEEYPDLYTEYLTAEPSLSDPEKILEKLKNSSLIYFPEGPEVSCTLKPTPEALSSTSASAFYLLPPIDRAEENRIYINENKVDERELFSTLAHEGYPGHLYQNTYYLSTDPAPIRSLLHCDGYDEGWGTYAQLFSYAYMEWDGIDRKTTEQLRQLYRDNDILSIVLSCLSDLYVNYKNYSPEDLTRYLSAVGVEEEGARRIYEYVTENPASYLSYGVGWYELEELRRNLEEELGEQFDLSLFHEAVLDCGSCPFPLLEEQVRKVMFE